MRSVKARKFKRCKNFHENNEGDILPGDYFFPQRRKNALCFSCGKSKKEETLISILLKWLASHGSR